MDTIDLDGMDCHTGQRAEQNSSAAIADTEENNRAAPWFLLIEYKWTQKTRYHFPASSSAIAVTEASDNAALKFCYLIFWDCETRYPLPFFFVSDCCY